MIFEQFHKMGVIPIAVLDDAKNAVPLAETLCRNGLPCAEIMFNSAAEESIKIISREFPDILVGAGRIMTAEQADRAMNAGAKFITSQGINPEIVQHCIDSFIPVIPGAITPSEVEQAINLGLNIVKFFPAEPAGGLPMIKALSESYNNLRFMPAGGITKKNIRDYLSCGVITACGINWITESELISSGRWDNVELLIKEAVKIVKEVRG